MTIRAGSLNPTATMDLQFVVKVARYVESATTGMDYAKAWTVLGARLSCDIAPIKDDNFFAQSGQQNVAEYIVHFSPGTDIRLRDRIQVVSQHKIVGPTGAWFEIMRRFEPTQSIAFVRCYACVGDAPV